MGDRSGRLAQWWATARSTYVLNQIEAACWLCFGVAGLLYRPIRESVPVLFFLSTYALVKGARATAQAAHQEMRQEQAEDGETGER